MEELDLKELISMFLEKKILIVLIVIIFALLGAIYTLKFVTPLYQSQTSLVLVQTGLEGSLEQTNSITDRDIALNSKLVDNYREIAKSKSVVSKVIKNLNLDANYETIKNCITISSANETEVIKIAVSNSDPELACKIANEVANVFVERAYELYRVHNVKILDPAEVVSAPYNVHVAKNIVVFAFVGFALISGYILLINMLDTTVKTDTDIERALGIPVLASIVLTEESPKKKTSSGKRIRFEYEHEHIQTQKIAHEDNPKKASLEDDNVSMFSYMYKDEIKGKKFKAKPANNLPKSAARQRSKNSSSKQTKPASRNKKKGDR